MSSGAKLQLALDHTDLNAALRVIQQTHQHIDIIEAGTLLCLAEGMTVIRTLRALYPQHKIVGDVRVARAGGKIATMVFDAGANWITVVGEAPIKTIEAVVKTADRYSGEVQIELQDDWTDDHLQQWSDLGIQQVIIHDEPEVGPVGLPTWTQKGFDAIHHLANAGFKVTVTGGMTPEIVPTFADFPVSIFIAGRGIAKAEQPLNAAEQFKRTIEQNYA